MKRDTQTIGEMINQARADSNKDQARRRKIHEEELRANKPLQAILQGHLPDREDGRPFGC